jgi:hypothetical protein
MRAEAGSASPTMVSAFDLGANGIIVVKLVFGVRTSHTQ